MSGGGILHSELLSAGGSISGGLGNYHELLLHSGRATRPVEEWGWSGSHHSSGLTVADSNSLGGGFSIGMALLTGYWISIEKGNAVFANVWASIQRNSQCIMTIRRTRT